jgi:hypothetical protein
LLLCAAGGASFCFGGFGGFAFSGFACAGGTAGVAGVAGFCAGGCAGCAGTAGVAGALALAACFARPGFGFPLPFELVGGGAAEAVGACAAVGVCAATVGGADAVVPPPPPAAGWTGTGASGVGAPGAGVGAPGAGVETPPPAGGTPLGAPAPGEPGPAEMKMGRKPVNGEGEIVGRATCGRKGSTSTGTLRSCVPGRARSRIAERSSTVKAWIHSWADATAPAATAPT